MIVALHALPYQKRKGMGAFTLVEMLVVITIVVILAALSIGAYRRTTQMGNQAVAMANERQIYLALVGYSNEHGKFPQITSTGVVAASGQPFWNQQIQEYLGYDWQTYSKRLEMPDVFYDPAATHNKLRGDFGVVYNAVYGPIKGVDPSLGPNTLVKMSATPLVVTAQQFQNGQAIGSWFAINSSAPSDQGSNPEIADRHRGGVVAIFADGHTIWMLRDEFYQKYMPFRNTQP